MPSFTTTRIIHIIATEAQAAAVRRYWNITHGRATVGDAIPMSAMQYETYIAPLIRRVHREEITPLSLPG